MREPELLASASCPSCTSEAPASIPHSTHKEHLIRLRRIEGQVRGIAKMVEEEQYCLDILNQIRAAKAALSAVESRVLAKHLKHCLQAAFATGDDATIDRKVQELVELSVRASGR
jgi:DNA-binding FrmR family transcriptional regulator